MWNCLVCFGLALIQEMVSPALGLAYAPVPPDQQDSSWSYIWAILGVIIAIAIVALIYKLLGNLSDKTKK